MPELLVVFQGIHQTLHAEGRLKERGLETKLVPTPPAVSLGCGFSILVPDGGGESLPYWWDALENRRALYRIVLKEGHKRYEEIDRR